MTRIPELRKRLELMSDYEIVAICRDAKLITSAECKRLYNQIWYANNTPIEYEKPVKYDRN